MQHFFDVGVLVSACKISPAPSSDRAFPLVPLFSCEEREVCFVLQAGRSLPGWLCWHSLLACACLELVSENAWEIAPVLEAPLLENLGSLSSRIRSSLSASYTSEH